MRKPRVILEFESLADEDKEALVEYLLESKEYKQLVKKYTMSKEERKMWERHR